MNQKKYDLENRLLEYSVKRKNNSSSASWAYFFIQNWTLDVRCWTFISSTIDFFKTTYGVMGYEHTTK
jgi:hypothetical protein